MLHFSLSPTVPCSSALLSAKVGKLKTCNSNKSFFPSLFVLSQVLYNAFTNVLCRVISSCVYCFNAIDVF